MLTRAQDTGNAPMLVACGGWPRSEKEGLSAGQLKHLGSDERIVDSRVPADDWRRKLGPGTADQLGEPIG